MDSSTTHSIPLPQLAQNGKRLPCNGDPQEQDGPILKTRNPNGILQRRSHSRSLSTSSVNTNSTADHTTARSLFLDCNGSGTDHSNGTGLSLRQQQHQRNQNACHSNHCQTSNSCNSSRNGSPVSLTLSITPPKTCSSYLDQNDHDRLHHPHQSHHNHNHNHNHIHSHSNNNGNISNSSSLLGSQDSLGSSLSKPGNAGRVGAGSRRASFNLSTGSLNFSKSSSTSLASPGSPSYSTIAVARAKAAAAAAAAGRGTVAEDEETTVGSGIFQGPPPSWPSPSHSNATSSSSLPTAAAAFDNNLYSSHHPNQPHPHLPPSSIASSSASSILSNGSGSSSVNQDPEGLSSSTLDTHLQENTNAEREISMILEDFLYLGGELVDDEQVHELEGRGIKRVLNMAANCDDELWIQRIGDGGKETSSKYLKVALLDHVDQDLKDGLDKAIQFIASSKDPVYVHCQAGKSRSVATVIGYLIQVHRWPLKKAYDHVVERRRIMSPNIGFVSQLIMLEERVLGIHSFRMAA